MTQGQGTFTMEFSKINFRRIFRRKQAERKAELGTFSS